MFERLDQGSLQRPHAYFKPSSLSSEAYHGWGCMSSLWPQTYLVFPCLPPWLHSPSQRALQVSRWLGMRGLQPCCHQHAACCQQRMEVCVSWKTSGNKLREYALCCRCTCWNVMAWFCNVDAEKAEGICFSSKEKLTRVLSGPAEFLPAWKKWGRNDANTLVSLVIYSCRRCSVTANGCEFVFHYLKKLKYH